MEDFGDIIFFVIAAAIGIISSIFGKKKKPAGKTQETEKKKSLSEELEDLFEPTPKQEPAIPHDSGQESIKEERYYEPEPETMMAEPVKHEPQFHPAYEGALEKGDYTFSSDSEGSSGMDQVKIAEARMNQYLKDLHGGDQLQVVETTGIQNESSVGARISRRFNLPDAIVYSEILNRKEF